MFHRQALRSVTSLPTHRVLPTLPSTVRTISSAAHRPEKSGPLYDQSASTVARRRLTTADHKPDTGGPLFDEQSGSEIHHPTKGGDGERAKSNEKKEEKGKEQKKGKMSGGSSFASLKMLRNEGKD